MSDLGITLVDTAEMYADGAAEELVGEGIDGRRDEAFLVSEVLPSNASRQGTVDACGRSLGRLDTDRLDPYLLHWRGTSRDRTSPAGGRLRRLLSVERGPVGRIPRSAARRRPVLSSCVIRRGRLRAGGGFLRRAVLWWRLVPAPDGRGRRT